MILLGSERAYFLSIPGIPDLQDFSTRRHRGTELHRESPEDYLKRGIITSFTMMMITATRNISSEIRFMPCIYFIHLVRGWLGSGFLM